jgi:LPS export ABC transporter protein LptC
MHQLPYPNHPETTIQTEAATLYPQQETAETNLAVTIQQQGNQVEGIGMAVDLNKGIINIRSHPKGFYRPA